MPLEVSADPAMVFFSEAISEAVAELALASVSDGSSAEKRESGNEREKKNKS